MHSRRQCVVTQRGSPRPSTAPGETAVKPPRDRSGAGSEHDSNSAVSPRQPGTSAVTGAADVPGNPPRRRLGDRTPAWWPPPSVETAPPGGAVSSGPDARCRSSRSFECGGGDSAGRLGAAWAGRRTRASWGGRRTRRGSFVGHPVAGSSASGRPVVGRAGPERHVASRVRRGATTRGADRSPATGRRPCHAAAGRPARRPRPPRAPVRRPAPGDRERCGPRSPARHRVRRS